MKKAWMITALAALMVGSSALADGVSGTLDMSVSPAFGISGSLNYTLEPVTGLVMGGSLMPGYVGGQFVLVGRVGTKYAQTLYTDIGTDLEGYVGLGANIGFLPSPLGFGLDASTGLKFRQDLSAGTRLYGDADLIGFYSITSGSFVPLIGGNLGLKFDVLPLTDLYVQAALASFIGSSPLGWDVRAAGYYAVSPQWKVGASLGYGNLNYAPGGQTTMTTISGAPGVSVRLGVLFVDKPNTIGTPGSHLP